MATTLASHTVTAPTRDKRPTVALMSRQEEIAEVQKRWNDEHAAAREALHQAHLKANVTRDAALARVEEKYRDQP